MATSKNVMASIEAAMTHGLDPTGVALSIDRFARLVAEGKEPVVAFRTVFDMKKASSSHIYAAAHTLMVKTAVKDLIEHYKKEYVNEQARKQKEAEGKTHEYDIKQAMVDARLAFESAKERGNASAMVAASTLMAKLHGLLVDKQEVKHGPMKHMSDAELDGEIAKYAAMGVIDKAKENKD